MVLASLSFTTPAPGDCLLKLSSSTNAHGGTCGGSSYGVEIPVPANAGNSDNCNDGVILKLSGTDNAHAEGPTESNYNTEICYEGVKSCTLKSSCGGNEVCIVELSDTTNAHLAECGQGYDYQVCCEIGEPVDCENGGYDTKDKCWEASSSCTWTPPGTNNEADGGHCCPDEFRWNEVLEVCTEKSGIICNHVWDATEEDQIPGISVFPSDTPYSEYCAQVYKGVSSGYKYPTKTY